MVDALIADPDKLTLGGEKRKMTIMFCDVRVYSYVRGIERPTEMAEVINTLLTELTNILDSGGTIDKYGRLHNGLLECASEDPKHAELAVEALKK